MPEVNPRTGLVESVLRPSAVEQGVLVLPGGVQLPTGDLFKLIVVGVCVFVSGQVLAEVLGRVAPEVEPGSFMGIS